MRHIQLNIASHREACLLFWTTSVGKLTSDLARTALLIIGYLPLRMESVRQMAGRSSRSMGRHRCKLVCCDSLLTKDQVEGRLEALDFEIVRQGMEVTRVMRGRRSSRIEVDRSLLIAFRSGWLMPFAHFKRHIPQNELMVF